MGPERSRCTSPKRPRHHDVTVHGVRAAPGFVTLSAIALLASGCGGTVDVATTGLAPGAEQACRPLVRALPPTLSDQERVPSTGAPGAAYAGGITVRCGVEAPAALDPFSTCQTVNGVDWYVPESAIEDPEAAVVATTIARLPRVELLVPGDLRPPAAALAQLTDAVTSSTRRAGRPCR